MNVVKVLFELRYFSLLLIRIAPKLTMGDFSTLMRVRELLTTILSIHEDDVQKVMKERFDASDISAKG